MLSRALRLATVTLLIGCLTAVAVDAVENLEAGKSPAQIFAGTCNACHKSPRGLLRSVPASSLPGFLRQHYTTSSDMASVLSSYLVSNGATDTRFQPKDGKDTKDAKKDGAKEGTKEAARTPADPKQQRLPRPSETPDRPDIVARPDLPSAAADKGKRDKGKKEPARTEPAAEPPRETAKGEEGAKPSDSKSSDTKPSDSKPVDSRPAEPKTESAKVEPAKGGSGDAVVTRPDPVPAVTPAPSTTAAASATVPPSPPAVAPGAASVPVQALDAPSTPAVEVPRMMLEAKPTVAAGPVLPPVPPAGPPMVPISQ